MCIEESLKLIIKYERLLKQARYKHWIDNIVFTFRWWLLLASLIIPWFIWYWLIDKKRIQEMFLYAFTVSAVAVLFDEMGTTLSLWTYPVKVIPILPGIIPINYTLVPIIFTLMYQYFPKWKSFIIANIILSFVFSFIFEPILVWGKFYTLISWKFVYSIPVYFFTAIILKWFNEKVKSIQNRA